MRGPQWGPYKISLGDKVVWVVRPAQDQARCKRCGGAASSWPPSEVEIRDGEDSIYERYCGSCMINAIKSYQHHSKQMPVEKPKKINQVCRFCWKKRKLIGAWCRTCRNKHQRKLIQEALEKLAKGLTLNWQEEQTLNLAPFWAVWKKEFRKVKIRK